METELQIVSERDRLFAEHVEKINSEHSAFAKVAGAVGCGLLAGANHRREIGVNLTAMKAATLSDGSKLVPHGSWEKLFATGKGKSSTTATFHFDYSTANRYMNFAEKHPEPIRSLSEIAGEGKQLLIDAGEIEGPDGTRSPQNSKPPGQAWLDAVSSAWEKIAHRMEKRALEDWPEFQRITLKKKLEPMVALYKRLS